MKNFYFALAILTLITSLCGCSSAKTRAEDALAEGKPDVAVQEYENGLRYNSDDAELLAGRQQARAELIRSKLIQVRMFRLSQNQEEQLKLLLWILAKEDEWNIAPDVKAASTQQEESEAAFLLVRARFSDDLQKSFPMRAVNTMRVYRQLIPVKELSAMEQAAIQKGHEVCRKFEKLKLQNTPFFNQFVLNFCSFWSRPISYGSKAEPNSIATEQSSKLNSSFFGNSEFEVRGDLDAYARSLINQSLSEAFGKTAWFHPKGTGFLVGHVQGAFTVSRTKTGVFQSQVYYEMVTKSRQVPYQDFEKTYDYEKREMVNKPVIKFKTESYEELEPRQKTRRVERTYRYPAWQYAQVLTVSLAGLVVIQNRRINFSISNTSHSKGIEHSERRPEMGLSPSEPNLQNPETWLKREVLLLSDSFAEKAQKLWVDIYCVANASSGAEAGNQALLCIRGRPSAVPAFAENWFQNMLGLNSEVAIRYLGF